MSVKLMSAIFEAEFNDLEYFKDNETRKAKASTCKLVLLAIADHANDYGESSYPGLRRLEIKTALSRQGLLDTIEALKYNGILEVAPEVSRIGTNNYSINLRSLPALAREMPDVVKPLDPGGSSHLTGGGQATLLGVVKPLDQNHQLTTIKPSAEKRGDLLDGMLAAAQMPGAKKALVKEYIFEQIKSRMGLNPSGKDAESFINYAADEHKKGRSFDVFLPWWLNKFPDPTFWSFRVMEQKYPLAFAQPAQPAQTILEHEDPLAMFYKQKGA